MKSRLILGAALLLLTSGCITTKKNTNFWYLTRTSVGLQIVAGQQTNSPGSLLLGYQREEGVVAPVEGGEIPSAIAKVAGRVGVTFTDVSGDQWFAIGDAATALAGELYEGGTVDEDSGGTEDEDSGGTENEDSGGTE